MYIKAFSEFSESNMDYTVSFYFRQLWRDERLQFDKLSVNDTIPSDRIFENIDDLDVHPNFLEHIWQPDPAFTDFKEGKSQRILTPSKMLRIFRNGTILYSTLMTLSVSCQMDLSNYPLDVQACYLELESFGYRTKNIKFKWKDKDPVTINDEIAIPQFTLDKDNVCPVECLRSYVTGEFSCLRVTFYFYRQVGYHMLQTYLPSVLIVSLSWISFYVNPDAIPARVTVGITSVLTLTTQSSGTRKELPAVSYIKAIDVWMTTCLTFVFAALLEFAVVNVLREREKKKAVRQLKQVYQGDGLQRQPTYPGREHWQPKTENNDVPTHYTSSSMTRPGSDQEDADDENKQCRCCGSQTSAAGGDKDGRCWCLDRRRLKARHVDHFSKVIFPATFLVFNITYWGYYLTMKYSATGDCSKQKG